MKKLLALLILVSVLFCFAACNKSEEAPSGTTNNSSTVVVEDVNSITSKYVALGYDVTRLKAAEISDLAELGINTTGVETLLSINSEGDSGAFYAFCESEDAAKAVSDSFKTFLKGTFITMHDDAADYTVSLTGKIVFFGHTAILSGEDASFFEVTTDYDDPHVTGTVEDDLDDATALASQLEYLGYGVLVVDSQEDIQSLTAMGIVVNGINVVVSVESPNSQSDGAFFFYCVDVDSALAVAASLNPLLKEGSVFAQAGHNVNDYLIKQEDRFIFFGHKDIAEAFN